jgi:xanthine dehydrogenase YagR molybdenum-binding subunit
MNHSFGEYHVPSHADIENIEVIFVDEPDPEVSPLGVKGLGEIGIVSVAPQSPTQFITQPANASAHCR